MSITLIEYSKRLQGVINDLQGGQHGDVMAQVATNALTMVKDRVQKRGEDTEGSKYASPGYSGYSTKPMLSGSKNMNTSAFSRIAGSKAKRKELEWRTMKNGKHLFVIPGGYKQFRELHGRKTSFIDFTFSGRMWSNVKLVSPKSELNKGIAVIKATQDIEKKKLKGNTERFGEILGLSKKEISEITADYENGIMNIFRKNQLT